MSENQEGSLQFAGAGQPPQASSTPEPGQQGAPGSQNGSEPRYMTKEEVAAMVKDYVDRSTNRIGDQTVTRVQKVLSRLQSTGAQVTAEQAQAVLNAIDEDGATQSPPATSTNSQPQNQPVPSQGRQPAQASPQGQQATPPPVHPVIATATSMMTQAGVSIEQDDPEAGLIDKETTDPVTFLTSIRAAIEAKQQRLSMAGDPARIPSLSGSGRPGNPVTQIKDPNELWKLARAKGK